MAGDVPYRHGDGLIGAVGGWRSVDAGFAARACGARGCPAGSSQVIAEPSSRRSHGSERRSKGDAAPDLCRPTLQRAPSARDAVRLADGKLAIRAGWACKPSPSNPTPQGAQAPCSLRQNKKAPDGSLVVLAERVGFEPTVRSPVRLISSQVHSTTLPPLQVAIILRSFRVRPHYRRWVRESQVPFISPSGPSSAHPTSAGRAPGLSGGRRCRPSHRRPSRTEARRSRRPP